MDESKVKRPWLSRDEFIRAIIEYKRKNGIDKNKRLSEKELDKAIEEYLKKKSNA